ncbi:MAG TPA: formate--tetrahydrofolate ligase [Deltaproteobacteria bacterium]|nr:formate--tetrahydrofolate ligase [Deltaproteobacteria bacterium]
MKSDIEIAQEIQLKPISEIAALAGIGEEDIAPYGKHIAKLPFGIMDRFRERPDGKLVLVTAMSPTAMGEGKTTTTIGLGQALRKIGKRSMMAIREPSLGPCMGLKGGAAGGGYSQVLPMEDINLHFTGDFHAITAAHNLLAAVVDNHLHHRHTPEINPRNVVWKRVMDMNDRSLRSIILGLEDQGRNGVMREDGFVITAASEIMAIFCLVNNLRELKERMGNVIVGYDNVRKPIFARDVGVNGAMAALLKHAINPNLVQSVEGCPVLIHGGPFANIAHGCNTVIATKMARKLSEYTITEAGFGADLGAEKFFHIKCRTTGLDPSACVLVVTTRAFNLHGIANIRKHLDTLAQFGIPVVVSINSFLTDSPGELENLRQQCRGLGVDAVITDFRECGGEGGLELAEAVVTLCETPCRLNYLYDLEESLLQKVENIARKVYGASGVEVSNEAARQIKQIETMGYGNLPVCIAKTQSSLTDNPKIPGFPEDPFTIRVTDARVSAGAGFVVIYTGSILSMPGLPVNPAALKIDIDEHGTISGLF